jgi:hypothetical protein
MSWQTSWVTVDNGLCVLQCNDDTKIAHMEIPFDLELQSLTCFSSKKPYGKVIFYLASNQSNLWKSDQVQIKDDITYIPIVGNIKLQAGTIIKFTTSNNMTAKNVLLLNGNPTGSMQINHQSYWQLYLKQSSIPKQITGHANMDIIYAPLYEKTKITHLTISSHKPIVGVDVTIGTGRMVAAEQPNVGLKKFVVANTNPLDNSDVLYKIEIMFDPNTQTKSMDISSRNIIIEPGHCIYIESIVWRDDVNIQRDLKAKTKTGFFHAHVIGTSI